MRYSCLQLVQAYAYIGSTRVYWMRLDDDDNNDDDNNDDDDGNENKWVLIIHSEAASVLHSLWTAHRIIRRRAELYWARYAKRASVDISNGNAMSASDIVGSQMRGEVIWARLHVCVQSLGFSECGSDFRQCVFEKVWVLFWNTSERRLISTMCEIIILILPW